MFVSKSGGIQLRRVPRFASQSDLQLDRSRSRSTHPRVASRRRRGIAFLQTFAHLRPLPDRSPLSTCCRTLPGILCHLSNWTSRERAHGLSDPLPLLLLTRSSPQVVTLVQPRVAVQLVLELPSSYILAIP